MKISEFIMTKALEYDDFRLTKIASELYNTEEDKEYILKDAGLIGDGIMAAGKTLLSNNIVRNAAIGTGMGALSGAISAPEGQRLNGALKGGLIGGVIGGGSTMAGNMYKTMKSNPVMTMGQAFKSETRGIGVVAKNASNNFKTPTPTPTSTPTLTSTKTPDLKVPAIERNGFKDINPMESPINPSHLTHPEMLNVPTILRNKVKTYGDAAKLGANVNNFFKS